MATPAECYGNTISDGKTVCIRTTSMDYEQTVIWIKKQGLRLILEKKMSPKIVHARIRYALNNHE